MHKMLALKDHMCDELKDGKSYAECAAKCHDTDSSLCETYLSMARERLGAYKKLKQQAARIYDEKCRRASENGEDVKHLVEVHEWYNDKMAVKEAELSILIESIR